MYDALLVLQSAVTKTTAFASTGVNLPTGTPKRGLRARFIATNVSAPTAGAVFTPTIDHSSDNTAWTNLATGTPLTAGTAATTSEQFIPVNTQKAYVRLNVLQSPTTGSPTMTYYCELGNSEP